MEEEEETTIETKMTNLFVNYLPQDVNDEGLREMFSQYGEVEACKVMLDLTTGQSRCFGFVKFESEEEAQAAITGMDGQKVKNKTLVVKYANQSNQNSVGTPSNNVYVKGIPPVMSTEQLRELFRPYGTITECKILIDPVTQYSRGMGFVRYSSEQEAEYAIQGLNNHTIPGTIRPLIVKYADTDEERKDRKNRQLKRRQQRFTPYGAHSPGTPVPPPVYPPVPPYGAPGYPLPHGQESNLFIYPLPLDADDALLYRLFSPYGAIESVKVARDPVKQVCRGYGFVKMVNWVDCWTAIHAMNGFKLGEKVLQVSFKKPHP